MKLFVTGTRGIPNIQGGVEMHCENLYPRIAKLGIDVTLIRRSCYINESNSVTEFGDIKLKDIYAPRKKNLEAITHTFFSVFYAYFKKADTVHIHGIGPAILSPLVKVLGMKVIVTYHSADYERAKWGMFAKFMLKSGERIAVRFADRLIVVSDQIKEDIMHKYGRKNDVYVVHNGVNDASVLETTNYIESLGLEKQKYIFTLGRFVEEKGFHNLIDAYLQSNSQYVYKLVIAGDADHETRYSENLKIKAKSNGIIFPGMVKGNNLAELYSHARLFVLPSFHEGMPISLLEAMSYKLDVLVSDIPANKDLIDKSESRFNPYDISELSSCIDKKLSHKELSDTYDLSDYNWDKIAEKTFEILKSIEK